MKEISHEMILAKVHYSPETGVFTRIKDGKQIGLPDRKGYLIATVCGKNFRLHRLAFFYMNGSQVNGEVDHINGISDDNRWSNLRECTHPQNNHNQGMRRTNTSGHKGIHWNKKAGKWHVQVCLNYKIHHGGLYADIDAAVAAARSLREHLHGEFANHG